jgi:hypothetical protein
VTRGFVEAFQNGGTQLALSQNRGNPPIWVRVFLMKNAGEKATCLAITF